MAERISPIWRERRGSEQVNSFDDSSSGTPATPPCTLMHNATLASGTAVSPAKVGQNESSTASPPPLNVSSFLNTSDPQTFPRAFTEGTISGHYPAQHISGLVRWPLLLKYGGVYADVGLIQIGDLDRLWRGKVGNPFSPPFDVLAYDAGGFVLSVS